MSKYRIVPVSEAAVKVQVKHCLFWKNIRRIYIGEDGSPYDRGVVVFEKGMNKEKINGLLLSDYCYFGYIEFFLFPFYYRAGKLHTEAIIKEVLQYFDDNVSKIKIVYTGKG